MTTQKQCRAFVRERSNSVCEICGQRRAHEMHHRRSRKTGPWHPSNILHLCTEDHRMITNTRTEYYTAGWLVHSWDDWAQIPADLHYGRVVLDNSGGWCLANDPDLDSAVAS